VTQQFHETIDDFGGTVRAIHQDGGFIMNKAILFFSMAALLGACSVTTTDSNDGGSTSADGGATNETSTTPPGTIPPTSTTEASVVFGATCPAFAACGGALEGTYDYTGGCVSDLLSDAKKQCAALDASGTKVSVKGSLHFVGPSALTRDVTATVSGTLKFPASCTAGQCAVVESALKSAGFATASCTGTTSCDCAIVRSETTKNATTYTTSGSTVITADGETYTTCVNGPVLTYSGKSAGSEDGTWTLKKR
jgi:hypothetical protein